MDPNVYLRASLQVLAIHLSLRSRRLEVVGRENGRARGRHASACYAGYIHLSYLKVLNPLIRVTTGSRRVTRIIDAMHNILKGGYYHLPSVPCAYFGVIVSCLRFYLKYRRHFRRFKGKIWR